MCQKVATEILFSCRRYGWWAAPERNAISHYKSVSGYLTPVREWGTGASIVNSQQPIINGQLRLVDGRFNSQQPTANYQLPTADGRIMGKLR